MEDVPRTFAAKREIKRGERADCASRNYPPPPRQRVGAPQDIPYAFRRRDMLVGSVAIFLAEFMGAPSTIAQRLDRSAAARLRLDFT